MSHTSPSCLPRPHLPTQGTRDPPGGYQDTTVSDQRTWGVPGTVKLEGMGPLVLLRGHFTTPIPGQLEIVLIITIAMG